MMRGSSLGMDIVKWFGGQLTFSKIQKNIKIIEGSEPETYLFNIGDACFSRYGSGSRIGFWITAETWRWLHEIVGPECHNLEYWYNPNEEKTKWGVRRISGSQGEIWFRNKQDLMMFKLCWAGV